MNYLRFRSIIRLSIDDINRGEMSTSLSGYFHRSFNRFRCVRRVLGTTGDTTEDGTGGDPCSNESDQSLSKWVNCL